VFLSAFHLERHSFEKIGQKIWNAQPQHSHLGPPRHQLALPFSHVVELQTRFAMYSTKVSEVFAESTKDL
jgi:hypothetical protein